MLHILSIHSPRTQYSHYRTPKYQFSDSAQSEPVYSYRYQQHNNLRQPRHTYPNNNDIYDDDWVPPAQVRHREVTAARTYYSLDDEQLQRPSREVFPDNVTHFFSI